MRRSLMALPVLAFAFSLFAADVAPSIKNVRYVENGTSEQTLDLYWPARAPSATVLFIHGGSLQEDGERRSSEAYRKVCEPFIRAAIACATMDYRLAPAFRWPAMPDDVAAAVAKVRAMVAERGGNPARLFLFGHSSGCHLAAIVSANPQYLRSANLSQSDIAGVIAMGCTLDREDAAVRGLTADAIRTAFGRDQTDVATYGTVENWLAANPASFVSSHVPPTLVVLAKSERYAPPVLEQGARYVRQLREGGVAADLIIVPGKHMTSIANLGAPGDPAFAAITTFIAHPASAAGD